MRTSLVMENQAEKKMKPEAQTRMKQWLMGVYLEALLT